MKKMSSILLAIVMVMGLIVPMAVTASADTPAVWDGSASIGWYFEAGGADGEEYELKSAEDLAGFAYLVNASMADYAVGGTYYGIVDGVYYDADYNVLGYRAATRFDLACDAYKKYTPTTGDNSQFTVGDLFEGKKVTLTVDVVLNEGDASEWTAKDAAEPNVPANKWAPIGTLNDNSKWGCAPHFRGIFDGKGHTISGLYCDTVKNDNKDWGVGLFGLVAINSPTVIKNIKLDNFYINGSMQVGAIAGRTQMSNLTLENCYVTNGSVNTNSQQAGGLVGNVNGGSATIEYCGIENVTVNSTSSKVGSFVGGLSNSATVKISNSYAKTTLTASDYVGAVAGYFKNSTLTVENVYTVAKLNATTADTGAAGCLYAGVEDGANVTAVNYYCVKDITSAVEAYSTIEGMTVVTLNDITGDAAKTTLIGFDWDAVWVTDADGTPVIELREAADSGDEVEDEDEEEDEDGAGAGNSATTEKSDTTDTDAETEAETEEKSGCGSSVGIASVAMIALTSGTALVIKKKKD